MHEVSLIESVVALVEDERRKQEFSCVRRIRLQVGALGPAEPDALRFCFEAVASGTIAEGAELEIETVPGEGWCERCSRLVRLKERFAACPRCGHTKMQMTGGTELRLAELEVE